MTLRRRLQGNEVLVGTWCGLDSTFALEIVAAAGFDWLCVDLQHGHASDSALGLLLQAADAAGVPVLVRPGTGEPDRIGRALDLGAAGVLIPLVESRSEAEAAVAACRYPPRGRRSWGPTRSEPDSPDPVCVVMVESAAAIDAVEAIASVDDLDGIFLGPNDLSLSLHGSTGTDVSSELARVVDACGGAGIIAGTACGTSDEVVAARAAGLRLLTVDWDIGMLRSAAASILGATRDALERGAGR
jgi:4-hydroxy-2-oxoheptanedioate aldolase